MQAIADACADGRIPGHIALVLGNQTESPALERARSLGLNTGVVPSPKRGAASAEEDDYSDALLAAVRDARPDLICLAGYIRKLPDAVVAAYPGRIMNMHNALLPSFGGRGMYGRRVHQAVLDYGAKVSGCTVHFVDADYDTGPVILQMPVPVAENDTVETLAARVLTAEHEAFPCAVALFAQGRLQVQGRRVFVEPGSDDK